MIPRIQRLLRSSVDVYQRKGISGFLRQTREWVEHRISRSRHKNYQTWLSDHQRMARAWFAVSGKKVAIVIPSYNDAKFLGPCLESLEATLPEDKAEIIIVDDASPSGEHRTFLRNIKTRIPHRVIFRDKNGGFAQAVNAGLRETSATDVIIFNSDIEAKPGWLESLQYGAYRDEKVGICGPKLLYPDGTIQSAGSHRNEPGSPWFDHYYRRKPASYGPANVPAHCIGVTGACLYVKREVLDRIGHLDEKFGMAFEDMDFCLRAWQAGYRSYYWPFAELVHHESVTRGRELGPREKASQAYFWEKWGGFLDDRPVHDADGRVRVIYVMETTDVAGGHRNIFDQLNRLKKFGYAPELWALTDETSWFNLEVPVKTFPSFPALSQALAREDAIKVATWWKTGPWVWLASVERGVPAWLVQDIESSYYDGDQLREAQVFSGYRREFRYFTICQWNVDQLEKLNVKATLMPCGINLETYKVLPGTPREARALLTNGRANPLKNLPLTLEAWGKARKQPELWMYGTEPELAKGLSNARYFERPSDLGINELLNKATAFILTSRHEGFALTILEAMAAGCPVICTDADGNRDFCVDGENCLMLGKDDAAGLTMAIERLFGDPKLQEKLRQAGLSTARAYDWDSQVRKLMTFFEGITASN